jgi:DNA-binding response OmpR family regulator
MAKEILIVESDKMVQEEFERIFETTDHHLFFTTDEEEALLRGKLFKPDLIIGGKRLCQTVRAEQDLEKVPFIILLDMFEDLSEQEQNFLRPDGILSRPLDEKEILNMVNHLSDGVRDVAEQITLSNDQPDWKSFSDIGTKKTDPKEDLSLHESWETDEEIIELVDVVEEPESRMSIDDFAFHPREDLIGEIAPMESWKIPGKEAEDFEKEFVPSPEEKEELEEASLELEEKEVKGEKVSPADELFEKIELEEILRKVEKLQSSIDKELLVEKEDHRILEIVPERIVSSPQRSGDPYTRLDEFEAALKGEVKAEPVEEALQPFYYQEMPKETPRLTSLEESPAGLELQELGDEEFPEVFLEELSGELERLKEEEVAQEKAAVETETEVTIEEEISELLGEDIEPLTQPLEEAARMEASPSLQTLTFGEEITSIEELIQGEELREPLVTEPVAPEAPKMAPEKIPPPVRLDRKIEEVIAKGVQEMTQDFINKVIPEMAAQMISLTLERIEAMVKEVVPDLAEKAIREEIQRLQKGEKD